MLRGGIRMGLRVGRREGGVCLMGLSDRNLGVERQLSGVGGMCDLGGMRIDNRRL